MLSIEDRALTNNKQETAKTPQRRPMRGRELLSLIGLTSESISPETYSAPSGSTKRRPTEAEKIAARARAAELQEQLDEVWRPRKERADMRSEIERNVKIGKGGSIGSNSLPKKRGRPRGGKPDTRKAYEDSDPDIDSLGYRPGQREREDRQLERKVRKGFLGKGKAQIAGSSSSLTHTDIKYIHSRSEADCSQASEDDIEPPPRTKKPRGLRPATEKPSSKKAAKAKAQKLQYEPTKPPYAPMLPSANRSGRTITNPHLPPTEDYYSPPITPQGNPYTSPPLPFKPRRATSKHGAAAPSFFEQRLAAIKSGDAVPRAFDVAEVEHSTGYRAPGGRWVDMRQADLDARGELHVDDGNDEDAGPGAEEEEL
ncbi:MAG: hypothetical protein Q9216_006918 [Gyalolechia sp. 2 TL-2023]